MNRRRFTGQEFPARLPSVANRRFDIAAVVIGATEAGRRRSISL